MNNHYKILINTCWIVLLFCFIIKIFGGNYFEIFTKNENFIFICNYIEKQFYLKVIINLILYLCSGYIYFCVIFKEKRLCNKKIFILFPIMIIKSILYWYYPKISFILDFIIMILIPLLLKCNFKSVLYGFILINTFQLISLFTRNMIIGDFNGNSFITQILLQIDYYIMLVLYYLYTFRKKEV